MRRNNQRDSAGAAPAHRCLCRRRQWQQHRRRRRPKNSAVNFLVGAGVVGAIVGLGSTATTPEGWTQLMSAASDVAVATGISNGSKKKVMKGIVEGQEVILQ